MLGPAHLWSSISWRRGRLYDTSPARWDYRDRGGSRSNIGGGPTSEHPGIDGEPEAQSRPIAATAVGHGTLACA
jgi:hypothetical protein